MNGGSLLPKMSVALICMVMTACATRDVQNDVPDFVLQHTLSSLTSEQSFAWDGPLGETFAIRPLGTFRSGDFYCRDYEISLEDVRGEPARRTACRFDKRWTDIDPSNLDF